MSAITTKIIEKYNFSSEMSVSNLRQYTSEFLENLTDDRKQNQARRRLQDGFKFSSEQVSILIPNQRSGKTKVINLATSDSYQIPYPTPQNSEETIREMAHRIMRDNLSTSVVKAEARALANSAPNTNAGSSRLSRLRRELKNLGTSFQIIEATKFPDITKMLMKFRKIDYDISILPDLQALADVMIMLCIRPAKLTTLHVTDSGVTGYAKNRECYIFWSNGNPGTVYSVVVHGARNLAHAMTIAGQALQHNPNNNTSPAQNYVIVNYRKIEQSPDQARLFRLYDKN
ncbi:hypothetical protein C2G38_2176732 [Gigaspora rosea]|uniref:Uncharacterized protein n=1 Tax=Gigaspora rosea TaxID=44941 RepID=A0A397VHX2_9GLOM|nr:hypothetical protein C2G38_2176732 [Gigaspora rosea]